MHVAVRTMQDAQRTMHTAQCTMRDAQRALQIYKLGRMHSHVGARSMRSVATIVHFDDIFHTPNLHIPHKLSFKPISKTCSPRSRAWWKPFLRTSRGRGWPRPPSTTSGWVRPTCRAGSRTCPLRRPTRSTRPLVARAPSLLYPQLWGEALLDLSPPLGGLSWMVLTLGQTPSSSSRKLVEHGSNFFAPTPTLIWTPCESPETPLWTHPKAGICAEVRQKLQTKTIFPTTWKFVQWHFAFEKGLRISLGGYSALDNSPSVARCSLLVELYSSHLFKEICFEMKGVGFAFAKQWIHFCLQKMFLKSAQTEPTPSHARNKHFL